MEVVKIEVLKAKRKYRENIKKIIFLTNICDSIDRFIQAFSKNMELQYIKKVIVKCIRKYDEENIDLLEKIEQI